MISFKTRAGGADDDGRTARTRTSSRPPRSRPRRPRPRTPWRRTRDGRAAGAVRASVDVVTKGAPLRCDRRTRTRRNFERLAPAVASVVVSPFSSAVASAPPTPPPPNDDARARTPPRVDDAARDAFDARARGAPDGDAADDASSSSSRASLVRRRRVAAFGSSSNARVVDDVVRDRGRRRGRGRVRGADEDVVVLALLGVSGRSDRRAPARVAVAAARERGSRARGRAGPNLLRRGRRRAVDRPRRLRPRVHPRGVAPGPRHERGGGHRMHHGRERARVDPLGVGASSPASSLLLAASSLFYL